jgi:hypothetical protein
VELVILFIQAFIKPVLHSLSHFFPIFVCLPNVNIHSMYVSVIVGVTDIHAVDVDIWQTNENREEMR